MSKKVEIKVASRYWSEMRAYMRFYNNDAGRVTRRLKTADVVNDALDEFLKRPGTAKLAGAPSKKDAKKVEVEIAPGNLSRLSVLLTPAGSKPGASGTAGKTHKVSASDIVNLALGEYLKQHHAPVSKGSKAHKASTPARDAKPAKSASTVKSKTPSGTPSTGKTRKS